MPQAKFELQINARQMQVVIAGLKVMKLVPKYRPRALELLDLWEPLLHPGPVWGPPPPKEK